MGKLDSLQRSLEARNEQVSLEKLLSDIGSIAKTETLNPARFEAVSKALASGLRSLSERLDRILSDIGRKPETFDPVMTEIRDLRTDIRGLTGAIQGIKLPEQPPFPEIPRMDLEPLHRDIDGIYQLVASTNKQAVEAFPQAVPPPRNWVFHVKRNRAGYIRDVEVTET
jgi:hypothetical protein